MLLQISEPLASQQTKTQTCAIGIDLGTTYSLAAIVMNDEVRLLTPLVPSVIGLIEGEIKVGQQALELHKVPSSNLIFSIKRLMGISLSQLQGQYRNSYSFTQPLLESAVPRINLGDHSFTPIELSAKILQFIKQQSEIVLKQPVYQAVITVPAYFNDVQRQATKDAANLAGLKVLRLLSEPTAAALAYGLDQHTQGIYAVYDLGGGTFDFSILKFNQGIFQVLATGGDTQLGGDDFDLQIIDMIQSSIPNINEEWKQFLHLKAKEIKHTLTEVDIADLVYQDTRYVITRAEFNKRIDFLIDKTCLIMQQVISDAKLKRQDIKGIVMVGGSTRVPYIQERITQFFNQKLLTNLNPDVIVAHGAALQAHALTQGSDTLLLDVVPLSLGIELMGGIVERIIERNAAIPACYTKTFTTQEDGQCGLVLHVVQGEREKAIDCRSLAHFTFTGIPALPAGQAKVKISFQIDADGLLTVSAVEQTTNISQTVEINATYGLSQDEMRHMLLDSFKHAKEDLIERQLIETIFEAKKLISAITKACRDDGHLLKNEQKEKIYQAIDNLEGLIAARQLDEIQRGIHQLNELTQTFADQRMNQAIKQLKL